MLRKPRLTVLAIVAMCLVDATMARGDTIAVSTADSGWYNTAGSHNPSNQNYISGDLSTSHFRNFFVFNLAAAAGEIITSAQLQLWTYFVTGSGTYTTYDVVTPVSTLTAGGSGQFTTYADLGSGVSFGSISLIPIQSHSLILITLNAAAIAAIQAQANVGAVFAIGGDFLGVSGTSAFASSDFNTANQLILQTQPTPVPDSASILALMLVVVLFAVAVKFSGLASALDRGR